MTADKGSEFVRVQPIAAPDHIADARKMVAAPGDTWPATDADEAAMAQADDAGNPAWWRGHDEACTILCQKVHAILDGRDSGGGVANEPWEATRRRLLAAALRSQGQADAVGETEWIVSCGSGASPAPLFDNDPAAFARWAEEVSIPSYIRSGRMRHASVTKVTTISEDRTTAALAQQANKEQPPNA